MATDLKRGAYAGKDTFLYLNAGTYETPSWTEIVRARNVASSDGVDPVAVNFYAEQTTSHIPDYSAFAGSFEYVRRIGDDAVFNLIREASERGSTLELMHLNADFNLEGSRGWRCPCLIGRLEDSAAGGESVVTNVPFMQADAYDGSNNMIRKVPVITGSGGGNPQPPPAPDPVSPPVISGSGKVGTYLTVTDTGEWSADPYAFGYQWYHADDAVGTNRTKKLGYTAINYPVLQSDLDNNRWILCEVVATNGPGSYSYQDSNLIEAIA